MVAAATTFTINAALVKKIAASGIDSFQIVFVRSVTAFIILLPIIWLVRAPLLTRNFQLQIWQAVAGTIALMSHFYSWTKLPLADVMSLLFTQALFVLILAIIILRANVSLNRWIATFCGFGGALLVIRPGFAEFQTASFLALFAGFCLALQFVFISKLPLLEKDLTMLFHLGLVSSLITLPFGVSVWKTPSLLQLIMLVSVGILGALNQACIIRAFRTGDAVYVAPFDYSKLIIAILAGFFFFGEIPKAPTLFGAGIIVLSTLLISLRR